MNFGNCVRKGKVLASEKHPCYFCGVNVTVKSGTHCINCGMWKCPHCGKCFCSASVLEKKTLTKVHTYYCQNYDRLMNFDGIDQRLFGDTMIVRNAEKALMYCSRKLRCQEQ